MERSPRTESFYSEQNASGAGAGSAESPGVERGHPNLVEFANGRCGRVSAEHPRHRRVHHANHYGCDGRSINDSIMEQLIMIDAGTGRRPSASPRSARF